jgi:hypothetical protein
MIIILLSCSIYIMFIRETPIPKVKPGGCWAKCIGIGKLNNPAKQALRFIPVVDSRKHRNSRIKLVINSREATDR